MQLAFSFQKKQVDKQTLSLLKSSLWWKLCIISSTSFRTSIMTQFHHTGLHFPCPDNVCLWCCSFPQKLRGVAVVELGTSISAAWLGLRWASAELWGGSGLHLQLRISSQSPFGYLWYQRRFFSSFYGDCHVFFDCNFSRGISKSVWSFTAARWRGSSTV